MIRTTRTCLLAASLLALPLSAAAQAEPSQGMTMDEVRSTFGSPASDLGAVGTPPITRWVYDGFTVYFENRRVLHTVRTQSLHDRPAAAPAPAPAVIAPAPAPAVVTPPVAPVRSAEPAPAAPVARPAPEVPVLKPVAEPAPAAVEPAAVAPAPVVAPQPAPVAAPAPAPAPAKPASSGFRFDPATGRLILDTEEPAAAAEETPEPAPAPIPRPAATAAPAPSAPAPAPSSAPAPAGGSDTGNALDETLEFDPETGTFRSIH